MQLLLVFGTHDIWNWIRTRVKSPADKQANNLSDQLNLGITKDLGKWSENPTKGKVREGKTPNSLFKNLANSLPDLRAGQIKSSLNWDPSCCL